ncbi:hypothetical protein FKM82_030753 [Ascaphus truei]
MRKQEPRNGVFVLHTYNGSQKPASKVLLMGVGVELPKFGIRMSALIKNKNSMRCPWLNMLRVTYVYSWDVAHLLSLNTLYLTATKCQILISLLIFILHCNVWSL